jgi:hypothetical protein
MFIRGASTVSAAAIPQIKVPPAPARIGLAGDTMVAINTE